MAKSYAQRNAESIARTGKSLYERRIESAQAKGLSRSQARGHAQVKKGERPASAMKPQRPPQAPKITKRVVKTGAGRMINTYSTDMIARYASQAASQTTARGTLQRIYFQVWNKQEGRFVDVYKGKRNTAHGITAEEFMRRVGEKLEEGLSVDEAIRDVISEDSASNAGADSPTGEAAPYDFTQIRMYVLAA